MIRLTNLYRLINALSIDIAFGAVVSAHFLANFYEVTVPISVSVCLGFTVWLIYTVDHLLDARRIEIPAATRRHRFHQVHFNVLLLISILVFVVIIFLLVRIQKSILIGGACLTLFVVLYFLFQRRIGFLKEIMGALLYSGGVLLPTLALTDVDLGSSFQIVPVLVFTITALINLILFSWFDRDKDTPYNHSSLISVLGEHITVRVLYSFFLLQFAMSGYNIWIWHQSIPFMVILIAMNVMLLFIFLKREWFEERDTYRLAGDAIFFFPLFLIRF